MGGVMTHRPWLCVALGLWRFFLLVFVAIDFTAEENRVGTTLVQFVDHLLALAVRRVYIFCDRESITGIMATWADQQNKSD